MMFVAPREPFPPSCRLFGSRTGATGMSAFRSIPSSLGITACTPTPPPCGTETVGTSWVLRQPFAEPGASYNIVPQKSWLTESRMLRIPAKTQAIRSHHHPSLGFARAQLQPEATVFSCRHFAGTLFSLPSVIS
jgi:hypothetical protein